MEQKNLVLAIIFSRSELYTMIQTQIARTNELIESSKQHLSNRIFTKETVRCIMASKKKIRKTDRLFVNERRNHSFLLTINKPQKKKCGFALMTVEKRKQAAATGGKISGQSRRETDYVHEVRKRLRISF